MATRTSLLSENISFPNPTVRYRSGDSKCWKVFQTALKCTVLAPHWLAGFELCPRAHCSEPFKFDAFSLKNGHQSDRFTIMIEGCPVDVLVIHTDEHTKKPMRWTIVAGGSGEGIESCDRYYGVRKEHDLVSQMGGSTLFFDYQGLTTRRSLVQATRAMMEYVESQEATEVTCVGASLGGGLVREAWGSHASHKKRDTRYAFLFDRTFSTYASAASELFHPITGIAVRLLGWNIGSGAQVEGKVIVVQGEWDDIVLEGAWLKQKEEEGVHVKNIGHMDLTETASYARELKEYFNS
ncbi:MAG: hypothetical protein S4CHLAM45_02310 [Chlamydiales bacterium]|nr:hypothetical protein [Chlamydiales bacterium]MCH9619090.1 hypothetical protein [Chlamydiales bacterium]MCH9622352.1 hypothetical protein [Chlamydiales bacterium]